MSLPRTIPDRSEWGSLRPPLEPGELRLAELLDDTLPDGWVIAVQAQLWNSRPDVIAYNPDVGLAVFEVKDWDPEARQFRYSSRNDALEARSGPGESWYVTRNPVGQVLGYRETAQSLYHGDEPARRFVTATVVMTKFPAGDQFMSDLQRTVPGWDMKHHQETFRVVGREVIEQGRTEELLPAAFNPSLQEPLRPRTIQRIEALLTEQEASAQQREPLGLDKRKKELIRNQPRRRRVCGPAGSGKSVLIAASAADAALSGREVLVIVFNITQAHHLRDLAVRCWSDEVDPRQVSRAIRDKVRFYYLHEWCEQVCRETGYLKKFNSIISSHYGYYYLGIEAIKGLLAVALETRDWPEERATGVKTFDRVLIDEAQNIDADWFGLIEQVLSSDESDLMVAYDPTQSLYLDEPSWTEEKMIPTGFRGRPVRLEYSQRLPSATIPMLTAYCEEFLQDEPDIEIPLADPQAELFPCELSYRNILGSETLAIAVAELVDQLPGELGIHPGDIAFVLWTHKTGMEVLDYLSELSPGWQDAITSVFGPSIEMQKRFKKAFWPGIGETKGSTIESFQGWESPCVVLGVPELGPVDPAEGMTDWESRYWRALYTGLTRVMNSARGSHLIVVNAEPLFEPFLDEHFEAL